MEIMRVMEQNPLQVNKEKINEDSKVLDAVSKTIDKKASLITKFLC